MPSPTNIRWAREEDLTALVNMARDMHAESPRFRHLDFSAVKTANCILALIINEDGGALVAEKGGHIVGMMGGFVTEHFFGSDRVAGDVGVYVVPGERGSTTGFRLIRAFEKWGKERGAKDIVLGVSTEVAADRTNDLYARMGYKLSGYVRWKELRSV